MPIRKEQAEEGDSPKQKSLIVPVARPEKWGMVIKRGKEV